MSNVLNKIRQTVEESFLIAERHFGSEIPRVPVSFDLTGKAAGQAVWSPNKPQRRIRFNAKLAAENEDHFLKEIVQHEVCHILDFHFNNSSSHGRPWRKLMIEVFHLVPKRTHSLDVSAVARKTRSYKYSCECPDKIHSMGGIRHKRSLRGAVYTCAKCKSEVAFVSRDTTSAVETKPNKYLTEEVL